MAEPIGAVARRGRRTTAAIRLALGRVDPAAIGASAGAVYLVAFLHLADRLAIRPRVGFSWFVVDRPFERALERTGPLSFEPVALLDLGVVRLLVSPIDVTVGAVLAALVGLNLAVAYLATIRPRSCGAGAGTGVAAAVPALLSGSACCAPAIVLALGVQASGAMLAVVPWLLPLGVALLLANLISVAESIAATD